MRNDSSSVVSSGSACLSCVAARSCWKSNGRRYSRISWYYRYDLAKFICQNVTIVADKFRVEKLESDYVRIKIYNPAIQKSAKPFSLLSGYENLGHMYINLDRNLGRIILGRPLRVFGKIYEYSHRDDFDPIRNIGIWPCSFDQKLPHGAVSIFITYIYLERSTEPGILCSKVRTDTGHRAASLRCPGWLRLKNFSICCFLIAYK